MFADFMRIILEVINCILTSGLAANPQLVRHWQQEAARDTIEDLHSQSCR